MNDGPVLPIARIFGHTVAPYHPLGGVEPIFRELLGKAFSPHFTENMDELATGLSTTRLVVAYADEWNTLLPDCAVTGLLNFVSQGGGLLVIHNGVCWARHPDLLSLIGASFAGHPTQEDMEYRLCGHHVITMGLRGFTVQEEPYRYRFAPGFSSEVFLRYIQDGQAWDAGWAHSHKGGRVVHLQPGHTASVFQNPDYASLVHRSALWCARLL
jgi:type 1 glutamine amidotransferase